MFDPRTDVWLQEVSALAGWVKVEANSFNASDDLRCDWGDGVLVTNLTGGSKRTAPHF